jgi:hypothetical protein
MEFLALITRGDDAFLAFTVLVVVIFIGLLFAISR